MKDEKTFDKPLNSWVEEEVEMPVFTPVVNEEENRVEFKQEMKKVRQRTFYSNAKPTRLMCADHVYACINKGKYLFKCQTRGCGWHRIAPPVTFKFDPATGFLTYRESGIRV